MRNEIEGIKQELRTLASTSGNGRRLHSNKSLLLECSLLLLKEFKHWRKWKTLLSGPTDEEKEDKSEEEEKEQEEEKSEEEEETQSEREEEKGLK